MAHKTILVVEDETPLIEIIAHRLKERGFNVITAHSISEAMKLKKQWGEIDAIWLDHYLPDKKTGLDFITYLYDQGHEKKIPIFVVTNAERMEEQYRQKEGVEGYYLKPNYRLDEIIDNITKSVNIEGE